MTNPCYAAGLREARKIDKAILDAEGMCKATFSANGRPLFSVARWLDWDTKRWATSFRVELAAPDQGVGTDDALLLRDAIDASIDEAKRLERKHPNQPDDESR